MNNPITRATDVIICELVKELRADQKRYHHLVKCLDAGKFGAGVNWYKPPMIDASIKREENK